MAGKKSEISTGSNKKQNYTTIIISLLLIIFILFAGLAKAVSKTGKTVLPSSIPSLLPSVIDSTEPSVLASIPPLVSPSPFISPSPSASPSPLPSPSPSPSPVNKADLIISEYSFDHPPKQGEAFTVKIGVYNQGNLASTDLWWEWWPTYAIKACRDRIDNLVAHGGRIVYCTYTYGGWSTYKTKAVADADNEIEESDEGNNIKEEQVIPIH